MAKSSKNGGDKRSPLDQIYSQRREAITDFVFDESVVNVFEDMISRSVPGYSTLLSMLPVLSRYYIRADTRCYDLGCSLGAATLAIQQSVTQSGVEIIAIDNSPAMIEQCSQLVLEHPGMASVSVLEGDVCDEKIQNASLVVMNFTLQFIGENMRSSLVRNIYQGLNDGGAFLLSEKIRFDNDDEQDALMELHHAFKKVNGYSDLEISQKRSALENVLVPETIDQHKKRLLDAGFSRVFVWFQCFNFVSLLAVK